VCDLTLFSDLTVVVEETSTVQSLYEGGGPVGTYWMLVEPPAVGLEIPL
jgi:hypothetical protein